MAVTKFKIASASALALALAALATPATAQSDPDRERPSWRGGSEGRAPRADNGGWQQRSAPAPRAEVPAPRTEAPAPPPQSRSAWGNAGGNRGNWEGRGNRENWQGRGEGEGRSREGRASWRGAAGQVATGQAEAPPPPAPVLRTPGWSGSGDGRNGRRDGDGWRERDGRGDNWRDRTGRGSETALPDRTLRRDGDRWRDRDGRRDGDGWRDRRHDGDNWRNGDRRTGWNSGSYHNDHRRWDRRWRDNRRYDWWSYRSRYPSYYNVGVYYAPYRHYRYRRLSVGFFLDSLFFSERYWISDPWYYRLPDAYGPYRWVRYYDDALLVNVYTGEVVDVIHRFFW